MKRNSSETELHKQLNELKESFINHSYKEHFVTDQSNRTSEVTRDALLTSKQKIENKPRITLLLKFTKTLPNIKRTIDEHWHLLQISPELKNALQEKRIIKYKRKRNLKEKTRNLSLYTFPKVESYICKVHFYIANNKEI